MADLKLGIGQVGITDYLLIVLRKTTDPTTIYNTQAIPPPVSASVNIVFNNIDPVPYLVDFRESPNGIALGTFLGTFQVDASTTSVLEFKFYKVGSGLNNAPDANTVDLIDPTLDGKNIIVFKEGLGRPLVPPTETFKEYDLYPGGGITLLNGIVWSLDEVIAVQIENKVAQSSSGGGRFTDVVNITASLTLDATHIGKRLRCSAAGSPILAVTMDDLGNVPDGAGFKFMGNDGDQNQTRILAQPGNLFLSGWGQTDEISFSKGESLVIEKRVIGSDTFWEVYDADPKILMVGERFAATWKDHLSCKPEEPSVLYDGDEWPRIWWWISNKLPASLKIVDNAVTGGGYTHPADKRGLIAVHSTLKKFRLGNMQEMTERGLKDFGTYGADTARPYDYPGGFQAEQPINHTHTGSTFKSGSHSSASSPLTGPVKFLVNTAGDGAASQADFVTGSVTGITGKGRHDNIGVIYMRRF